MTPDAKLFALLASPLALCALGLGCALACLALIPADAAPRLRRRAVRQARQLAAERDSGARARLALAEARQRDNAREMAGLIRAQLAALGDHVEFSTAHQAAAFVETGVHTLAFPGLLRLWRTLERCQPADATRTLDVFLQEERLYGHTGKRGPLRDQNRQHRADRNHAVEPGQPG